jgi:hypothetical protein
VHGDHGIHVPGHVEVACGHALDHVLAQETTRTRKRRHVLPHNAQVFVRIKCIIFSHPLTSSNFHFMSYRKVA